MADAWRPVADLEVARLQVEVRDVAAARRPPVVVVERVALRQGAAAAQAVPLEEKVARRAVRPEVVASLPAPSSARSDRQQAVGRALALEQVATKHVARSRCVKSTAAFGRQIRAR